MVRLVDQGIAALVVVVGVVYIVVPTAVREAFAPVGRAFVDAVVWAEATLPYPVFLVVVLALTTVVAVLITIWLARLTYSLLRLAGPRTKRLYRRLMPSTPIGKMGVGISLLTLIALGSVWTLPMVIGGIGAETPSESDRIGERQSDVDGLQMATGDALAHEGDATADAGAYDRPARDSDGDRVPDEWERAGETPDGVALPASDPDRMTLYVQLNYGNGVIPLTETEKRQLREVWADMAVENPDGSEGVDLHLDDDSDYAGPVGTRVAVSGSDYSEVHQFYTPPYLGDRRCVYHQVVVGEVEGNDTYGVANSPGYAAVVEDGPREYEGDLSPRVHVITHQLLHNVVAETGDAAHADGGWRSRTVAPGETYLDEAAVTRIEDDGFAGSGHYRREVC